MGVSTTMAPFSCLMQVRAANSVRSGGNIQIRSLAYKPQPHPLKGPRPSSSPSTQSHSLDPSEYHAFISSYTGISSSTQLSDAVAQQIFTHKSFKHGKAPYNEKLAFLGRRVLYAHLSSHIMSNSSHAPSSPTATAASSDASAPSTSPSPLPDTTPPPKDESSQRQLTLQTLESHYLSPDHIGTSALRIPGLASLLRWTPRDTTQLHASGQVKVAGDAVTALVGALELQCGGDVAAAFVRRSLVPVLTGSRAGL